MHRTKRTGVFFLFGMAFLHTLRTGWKIRQNLLLEHHTRPSMLQASLDPADEESFGQYHHRIEKIQQPTLPPKLQQQRTSQQQLALLQSLGDRRSEQTTPTLDCRPYGGPDDAQEMVYWRDIPSDSLYVSPFRTQRQNRQYLTLERDGAGFNNIRMALETTLALGMAMGRTIVLPPKQWIFSMDQASARWDLADFFPLDQVAQEMHGLEFVSMKEFLELEAGNLRDKETGQVVLPPGNRTDWDGAHDLEPLTQYLRSVATTPHWNAEQCPIAFPESGDSKDVEALRRVMEQVHRKGGATGRPPKVNGTTYHRLRDHLSGRNELCVYDEELQKSPVVHIMSDVKLNVRLLVHFYAFVFFADWRADLWMKRFVRDHLRYKDELQCAAARVVQEVRALAQRTTNTTDGDFDAFHVRRGDFERFYKESQIDGKELYERTKDVLRPNSVVFLATNEKDKEFFAPLREHYTVVFLDDFPHVLSGIDPNLYGILDQLVAARAKSFFGCWLST